MEVSGKFKTPKMNGGTKVPILAWFPIIKTIAYARAGCQCFKSKSLCLYKLPTIQTTPNVSAGSLRLPRKSLRCAGPQQFKRFLTLVQASDHSHVNPDAFAGSKQFLMLVQAMDSSHANSYTCAGSNNSKNSLCVCRLPKIHTQILMLVKVPNNSKNSLRQCRLWKAHTRILPLVKAPKNSNNLLHD
ncbi:hypothetical protein O181_048966 [Austropuccinia psidii MF-1]|uniref:Uncharacterized protein n=1 Tax=Austropuccinia psidii MF-1 TaxID=1389203 RepID=A0A9Q3DRK9_9BASI|nr:hypothetical protein [Austropuccinia psidii MF-1]